LHEPLRIHTRLTRTERDREVGAILAAVDLPDAHLDLYPHELSGGQQRRVGLARIRTLRPRLVILDEPTSGLDVSVQASVLKLFRSLQATFALTYVFISHDLAVARAMCAGIAVMYLGKIVELGPTAHVFETPRRPYTQSLLAAVPRVGGRRVTQDFALEGEPPNPRDVPSGCRFRTRCPLTQARCATEESTGAPWPVTSPDAGTRGIVQGWPDSRATSDPVPGPGLRLRDSRGGLPEQLLGRGGPGATVVVPVRQVAASQDVLERPPERAQDLQRARRGVVGVDLEAQQVVDIHVEQLV